MNTTIKKPSARHQARLVTTQLIYAWMVSNNDPQEIFMSYMTGDLISKEDRKLIDRKYLNTLFDGVVTNDETLINAITPYLDRNIEEFGIIEVAILKYAFFELMMLKEVPYQVIINEAIEVCKSIGAQDSYQSINACLDKARRVIRP